MNDSYVMIRARLRGYKGCGRRMQDEQRRLIYLPLLILLADYCRCKCRPACSEPCTNSRPVPRRERARVRDVGRGPWLLELHQRLAMALGQISIVENFHQTANGLLTNTLARQRFRLLVSHLHWCWCQHRPTACRCQQQQAVGPSHLTH